MNTNNNNWKERREALKTKVSWELVERPEDVDRMKPVRDLHWVCKKCNGVVGKDYPDITIQEVEEFVKKHGEC